MLSIGSLSRLAVDMDMMDARDTPQTGTYSADSSALCISLADMKDSLSSMGSGTFRRYWWYCAWI